MPSRCVSLGGIIGQTLALTAPDLFLTLSLCDTSSRQALVDFLGRHA